MHIIGEVYLKISEDILQCYTYIFTDVHENMSTYMYADTNSEASLLQCE